MNNDRRVFLVVVYSICMQCSLSIDRANGASGEPSIEPDSAAQDIIAELVLAESQEEVQEKLSQLKGQCDGLEQAIQQIIYFQLNTMGKYEKKEITGAELEQTGFRAYAAIALLLGLDTKPRITPESSVTLINAVLPYLRTSDPNLRERLHEVLEWIDQRKGPWKDYSGYEPYIRSRKDNPPSALVEYMYQKAPDVALSSLANVYLDADEAKAMVDRVKGEDDAQTLDRLSRRPEWWAQLYVAEKLRKNPKLQSSAVLERIKKSDNPLVRESVGKIGKK